MYLVMSSWNAYVKTPVKQVSSTVDSRITLPNVSSTPSKVESVQPMSPTLKEYYQTARERTSLQKKKGQIDVDWEEAEMVPEQAWVDIFSSVILKEDVEHLFAPRESTSVDFSGLDRRWISVLWKIGTVQEGLFKNGSVYLAELDANYPALDDPLEFVLSEDGSKLAVVRTSETMTSKEALETFSSIAPSAHPIEAISLFKGQPPNRLHLRGREFELSSTFSIGVVYDASNQYLLNTSGLSYVTTTDEGVDLYQERVESDEGVYKSRGDGCLLALIADGRWVRYSSFLPTFMDEEVARHPYGEGLARDRKPGILWKDEYENDQLYYGVTISGCGLGSCSDLANLSEEEEADLVQVGMDQTTKDPVFFFRHPEKSTLIAALYDTWYLPDQTSKPTIQEMVEKYKVPIFFWKDPMGRWNRYTVSSLMPAVECGKPVIYLYPETQTDVRVALPKFINVTVSDPSYPAKGWSVTAKPNGDLISKADGKTYGSLYWEGTGVGYQSPTTGFVVSSQSVTTTLASLLTKYGLNQKESFEFMEFWLPRFAETKAPYFRVSFLTDQWSKAAPLAVSPKPKTSIRIFMDWQPLSAPISITEPRIITPKRNGFTLVEWGGTLYK